MALYLLQNKLLSPLSYYPFSGKQEKNESMRKPSFHFVPIFILLHRSNTKTIAELKKSTEWNLLCIFISLNFGVVAARWHTQYRDALLLDQFMHLFKFVLFFFSNVLAKLMALPLKTAILQLHFIFITPFQVKIRKQ